MPRNTNAPAAGSAGGRAGTTSAKQDSTAVGAAGPAGAQDLAELARLSYADHPGAAPLLRAVADETLALEVRWRALAALDVLDPRRPLPALETDAPLAPVARAIAALVLAVAYSTDRDERRRAAELFSELCTEAARIEKRRRPACAA